MTIAGYITLGLSLAGFFGGIIVTVAKLSTEYGKIKETIAHNEVLDKEERQKASVKFAELYSRMAESEGDVKELNAKVDTLQTTCVRIESKLDKLIERS